VANVARNQHRAAFRWARAGQRVLDANSGASAEAHAIDRARRDDLWHALDALPLRLRDVVVCRYLLDMSEAETSQALDIARGTVKSRLSRALERLERSLPAEVLDD
jgi:RNA polymerase sigma-70 factor (ECF subfamily)